MSDKPLKIIDGYVFCEKCGGYISFDESADEIECWKCELSERKTVIKLKGNDSERL